VPAHDRLSESLSSLSTYFVGGATMGETLHRVSELAVDAVPATNFIGITMMVGGRPGTAIFTDPDAPQIDQAQYDSGRGPCLDAFHTGRSFTIASTERDDQWPEFSRACLAHGIHSTMSLPLNAADQTLGAMNMYSNQADAFTTKDLADATTFAAQAAIVLANAQAYTNALATSEQLSHSITSRETIEQAKGIIMASMHCTPDEAFDQLVKQSQSMNVKLREIADRIVKNTARRP
jgi:GAF domain-containing protein